MRAKDYIVEVLREIVYVAVMSIYLLQLNFLNKELLSKDFKWAFNLLQYKNYAPLKFFAGAVILFFVGCVLVYLRVGHIREKALSFEEIIVSVLAIILTIMLLILLIALINNPILRTVFITALAVVGTISIRK